MEPASTFDRLYTFDIDLTCCAFCCFLYLFMQKNSRCINLILFDKLSFLTVKSCTSSEKMNISEQFSKNKKYSTPLYGSILRLNSKISPQNPLRGSTNNPR